MPHRKRASACAFKKAYGITLEDKEAMFVAQGRVCACCGSSDPLDVRGWHYDHDHDTKKGRGVTCGPCNMTLGVAKESIHRLECCAVYLRKHSAPVLIQGTSVPERSAVLDTPLAEGEEIQLVIDRDDDTCDCVGCDRARRALLVIDRDDDTSLR